MPNKSKSVIQNTNFTPLKVELTVAPDGTIATASITIQQDQTLDGALNSSQLVTVDVSTAAQADAKLIKQVKDLVTTTVNAL